MQVTLEQLQAIFPNLPRSASAFVLPLNECFEKYQINTPLRVAAFLAQVGHESNQFRDVREIWGPTEAQKRYEPPSAKAKQLGNTIKGDGKKYSGKGLIQLTGRANYRAISKSLGVDFVEHPELLTTPKYACLSAGWYWDMMNINHWADQDNIVRVTQLVNGAENGLISRVLFYKRAKAVIK